MQNKPFSRNNQVLQELLAGKSAHSWKLTDQIKLDTVVSMFYQDIFKAFHEKNIRYLVIGAIAMNLHGAPRMTRTSTFCLI